MIPLLAILIITSAFFAVDSLAKHQRDMVWRQWLNDHRPGIGPDGLDCMGNQPRKVRRTR
jgi:hypothetical protein